MLLVTLAIAPGIFWLWYFLQRDQLRPEPRFLVRRVFMLGAVAALVAAVAEVGTLRAAGLPVDPSAMGNLVPVAAIIGMVEEGFKFVAVFVGVYRHAAFDEVLDGIIYMVTASMGFATIENIAYVLKGGFSVAVTRAFLSVPGHAFFSALMGFYMGVAKFSGPLEGRWLLRGFGLAALAHAGYDAALFTGAWPALIVIPLVAFLWRRAAIHVQEAQAMDDQRFRRRA